MGRHKCTSLSCDDLVFAPYKFLGCHNLEGGTCDNRGRIFVQNTPLKPGRKHEIASNFGKKTKVGIGYLPGGSARGNGPLSFLESIAQFHKVRNV